MVVYLAPLRALCQERTRQWSAQFHALGLRCLQYTGDSVEPGRQSLLSCDVLLCTPEKFDGLTRRRDILGALLARVGLLCIDEVHLLHEARGACLEGIVARLALMRSKARAERSPAAPPPPITRLRLAALSATIQNVDDIAAWVGSDCAAFTFSDDYRPCPMTYKVLGYPPQSNPFHFERSLDTRLVDVLQRFSARTGDPNARLPSLVFCNTRKATAHTAKVIAQECAMRGLSSLLISSAAHANALSRVAAQLNSAELQAAVRSGVGFHHAGMEHSDREALEAAFLQSTLLVLCTTTTLALGVNLPAHLVVIKSTSYYMHGRGWVEYEPSAILQMTGRAGRPQFDVDAVAVVMCDDHQRARYEALVSGLLPIESTFKGKLIEHLNSEVVSASISCMADAVTWMEHTFLFVRILRNPQRYDIPPPTLTAPRRQAIVQGWLSDALQQLSREECIAAQGERFVSAEKGRVMNQHYLSFPTIRLFSQIAAMKALPEVLYLFCQAAEHEDMRCRLGEKSPLNAFLRLTAEQRALLEPPPIVPFPLPSHAKGIKDTADKLFVLAQGVCIGRALPGGPLAFNLKQDVEALLGGNLRVARAMEEYACEKRLSVFAIKGCIQLRKSLERRCFVEGDRKQGRLLTQLVGIGPVHSLQLASAGFDSFERLRAANRHAARRRQGTQRQGARRACGTSRSTSSACRLEAGTPAGPRVSDQRGLHTWQSDGAPRCRTLRPSDRGPAAQRRPPAASHHPPSARGL